jgi:aspartate aminotransferase-like enzyme
VGHRTSAFVTLFEEARRGLRELTGGGSDVALLCGSGTLANDAVAANLAADANLRSGMVLVNGEFGERLSQHAARAGLSCKTLVWDWGKPWDLEALGAALKVSPDINWVWGVHLESSTGVLNDLRGLVRVAGAHGARVCIDCMSSLGATPIDLAGVHMASGASGKSLGSYAGLAIVMASPGSLSGVHRDRVIPSLDVASAIDARGPRFTFASAPVVALREALRAFETESLRAERYERYARMGQIVRAGLRDAGVDPIAPEAIAAPVITSFVCPRNMGSAAFVALCRKWGFDVAGLSRYLERRGWSQIATMGPVRESDVRRFLATLARWMASH